MLRSCRDLNRLCRVWMQNQRQLSLQEYQSKSILAKHGCVVQTFIVADSKEDAEKKLNGRHFDEYVVKAQILAGGRGKGRFIGGPKDLGGVYISNDKKDALNSIPEMVGRHLVTKQTSKKGALVDKVMVAEGVTIVRETYLAVLLDRDSNGPVIVASPAGGMDIEEVAEKQPELIFKEVIDITKGIAREQSMRLAKNLNFEGKLAESAADQIERLYQLCLAVDATQVEINPFVETSDGKVYCVDAKMNFDDSAQFRQKEIFEMGDRSDMDQREIEADQYNLNYIPMQGNIGCLVNGAGLAMATMDIIKLNGGEPANFLDVGGAVTEEGVFHAFRIITSDPQVKCVLVNIFGGIVNCATIARGIIAASQRIKLTVPLVVRLEGTNVDEARKLIADSGLPVISAHDLNEAASKAVAAIS
ncbi:unnamed protein product, partial [Mesorhabditis spiculigera]